MKKEKDYIDASQSSNAPSKEKLFKSMMIKSTIGALFIVVSLEELLTDTTSFLVGLVIGGGLIIWGVVPYNEYKKIDDR